MTEFTFTAKTAHDLGRVTHAIIKGIKGSHQAIPGYHEAAASLHQRSAQIGEYIRTTPAVVGVNVAADAFSEAEQRLLRLCSVSEA
jgi:hypothetical protein